MSRQTEFSEIVSADGHLIDSQLLNEIFNKVIERRARFEVLSFDIGRTNEDFSHLQLKVTASDSQTLHSLLKDLTPFGCYPRPERNAILKPAEAAGIVPNDFYSTTNHRTYVCHEGQWLEVNKQRMDAVVVVSNRTATCRKLREIRQDDLVVCGVEGVRVSPEFRERDRLGFAFMTNDVSTERRAEVSARKVVALMREVKKAGAKIAFVAGPVVIHSGGCEYFANLIRDGYVDVLLAGNALAVHDAERALFGTSLGVDLELGRVVEAGHHNHMRAINIINRAGGLRPAVDQGILQSGVMYEAINRGVEYVLAGSIRDDGPLTDTMMNMIDAQDRHADVLRDVKMVVMLSTMLHSIGVGNMLPSSVRVVCVDINPAVVTKLIDRGSAHCLGIVTDVGLFLHQLSTQLSATAEEEPNAIATKAIAGSMETSR